MFVVAVDGFVLFIDAVDVELSCCEATYDIVSNNNINIGSNQHTIDDNNGGNNNNDNDKDEQWQSIDVVRL